MFEYINLEPSMPIKGGKKIPYHSLFGDVEFRDITFTYPSRPQQVVLDHFSLKVPAGHMVLYQKHPIYFPVAIFALLR